MNKPAHTELVGRKVMDVIPERVFDEVIDRGERAVRRVLREWPFGKELEHQIVERDGATYVEWFWVGGEEDDEVEVADPWEGWTVTALDNTGICLFAMEYEGFTNFQFPENPYNFPVDVHHLMLRAPGESTPRHTARVDPPCKVPPGDLLSVTFPIPPGIKP